jgi:CheY-like chemotaxis protein
MTSVNQLLHQIADPHLTHDERAQMRCQLAKELEDTGNYEAAREAMGQLWSLVGERPILNDLAPPTAAEVLLRAGVLTGWIGSVKQIESAQEFAKNLLSESLSIFESLGDKRKIVEVQMELGHCYWREGAFDEARVLLSEALSYVGNTADDLKAIILSRLATVEKVTLRLSDALRLLIEAAPLFEKSSNHTLKGKFHNEFATVLKNLGAVEHRSDYIDRALIEYAASSYHFEQARHSRYQACVENNLGMLFCTAGKYKEAHEHLDRAQALMTSLKDTVHLAQVDETRARVCLAEGKVGEAEKLARAAVGVLERGGEQSLLAEALTTQGTALARLGRHVEAGEVLLRAAEVAEAAGDAEGAGQAALTIIEELGERLELRELEDSFKRADALLANSRHPGNRNRLYACARKVMFIVGVLPGPDTWEEFSFRDAVRRYEARLIEGALRDSGGVVARASQMLGLTRQSLDAMLHRRHRRLLPLRTPIEPRRSSLMFREGDREGARCIQILHAEDDEIVAEFIGESLGEEGWRVNTFRDGADALREVESDAHYDLMVIDHFLPGVNGIEIVSRARELEHRQQVPIIVLSAADVERDARRAGASAFLRKPDDVPLLAETVARLENRGGVRAASPRRARPGGRVRAAARGRLACWRARGGPMIYHSRGRGFKTLAVSPAVSLCLRGEIFLPYKKA